MKLALEATEAWGGGLGLGTGLEAHDESSLDL